MKLSEMPAPALALSGLELLPVLQGSANAGLPLLSVGALPTGTVLQLRRGYTADISATTDADPGPGKVRWNHVSPSSATALYIDDVDADSGDISATWAALAVGGFVYLQGSADGAARAKWQKWQVTSVVDAAGYAKVGVVAVDSEGTFANGEALELTLQQPSPTATVRTRQTATTVSTLTPAATDEMCTLTGQASPLSLAAPAGAWADGEPLVFRIKATGSHAFTWDAVYRGIGGALPGGMVSGKWMYFTAFRNAADSRFDVILPATVQP